MVIFTRIKIFRIFSINSINVFIIGILVSSGETESINVSSGDSSLEQTVKVKDPMPKGNPKDQDKNTKVNENNELYKKEAGDTKTKDNKGSAESTKEVGKDDKTRSSTDTTRKSVRPRRKTAKPDKKVSSTPTKLEDVKNKPENRGEHRGKKRANNDDGPMLRDEKDIDETVQESGIINLLFLCSYFYFKSILDYAINEEYGS